MNVYIFCLKDKSLENPEDLRDLSVLAQEVAENPQTALEQFNAIAGKFRTPDKGRKYPLFPRDNGFLFITKSDRTLTVFLEQNGSLLASIRQREGETMTLTFDTPSTLDDTETTNRVYTIL
jgi:hypothetical protein